MFSRIGAAAYKADLTNTIELCKSLGDPQHSLKTIHVAGTNGKGSVSHMLAAIFQTAGYKTGLYTSPHLKDFRERIKVNGKMIPEGYVIDFTEEVYTLIEKIEPSFFEITVAMALNFFKAEQVDIAIIETGLGGRLDSTNIIQPEVSVITNIGMDHMNLLGSTIEEIAGEKAGIIKSNMPVIIGEVLNSTRPVFEKKAASMNAPLSIASEKRKVTSWGWEKHELIADVEHAYDKEHHTYHLDLPGIYQTKNLLTVLETVSQLRLKGWVLSDNHLQRALKQTKKITGLHGRWDIIREKPLTILDVAHNEDGIRQLIQHTEIITHRELHIVIGMVKDKDLEVILKCLPSNAHYYFTKAQIPRAVDEQTLQQKANEYNLNGVAFPEVNEALAFALNQAHPDDLVIVCGSVFLIGEVEVSRGGRSEK